ncbi:MAG: DUF6398 domain-containing protein [Methanobrevibacter sp.]|jgi:hypothetical protein|nr:DUF6398 domain-containing protein [Candidatus Methanoflexus mossambicus]
MAKDEKIKEKENKILNMVESFCDEHINDEYKELSTNLVKKMGRKHDVPFKRGKLEIWASAAIYAIGQMNFLFDNSFEPYVTPDEICDYFKTKKSTVGDKARKIRDMFNMNYYDAEFSTEDMKNNNPYDKFVMDDSGFIMPKSLFDKDEEEYTTMLDLMNIDNEDLSEEELLKKMLKELEEQKGEKLTTEEIEKAEEFLLNPIPIDIVPELLKEMANQFENFDENDNDDLNIELFDDYVIDESNPMKTIEDYQRAIELFENTKGKEYFEENKGYFWLMQETRPYMTHILEQAMMLWDKGEKEKSIKQLEYLLDLNPGDNQGVRYILINRLIELNKLTEAEGLIELFDEEYSAEWAYSELLLNIKQKEDEEYIKHLYDEAIEVNKYVVDYLIGKKKLPKMAPQFYSPGDESEAEEYLRFAYKIWKEDKIAMDTLKKLSTNKK